MDPNETSPVAGAGAALALTDLAPGAAGTVVAVDARCPVASRLLDLGFTPGTPVRAVRRAPLGDPMLYELRGMRLCLRRSEAAWVTVRCA